MNEDVKAGYNKIARSYAETRDQFKSLPYLEKLIGRLKSGVKILDLGCGSGVPVDRFLTEQGFEVTGVDISESQIELARENVPQANYQVGDMSELSDGQFQVDAVVSFYAIFHTPREQHIEIFKKMRSWLSDDGMILVTMGAGEWEGEEDFYGAPMRWSHYDAEKNKKIIQQAGFKIIFSEIDTTGDERHLVVMAQKESSNG